MVPPMQVIQKSKKKITLDQLQETLYMLVVQHIEHAQTILELEEAAVILADVLCKPETEKLVKFSKNGNQLLLDFVDVLKKAANQIQPFKTTKFWDAMTRIVVTYDLKLFPSELDNIKELFRINIYKLDDSRSDKEFEDNINRFRDLLLSKSVFSTISYLHKRFKKQIESEFLKLSAAIMKINRTSKGKQEAFKQLQQIGRAYKIGYRVKYKQPF